MAKRNITKWKPKAGEKYYIPTILKGRYINFIWYDTSIDNYYYKLGVCCRTKREAIKLSGVAMDAIKHYIGMDNFITEMERTHRVCVVGKRRQK